MKAIARPLASSALLEAMEIVAVGPGNDWDADGKR